jgi:hypothetical protein
MEYSMMGFVKMEDNKNFANLAENKKESSA